MTSPLHNLGLRFTGSSSNIRPEGLTAHYGGPSPWGSVADRSSPARFRDTTDHARCPSIARAWHDFHLSKGWFGFAYTSGVCPHGHRYEGRGPGRRTGANGTNPGNLRSYATVYIAGDNDPVTDEAKRAFLDETLRLGVPLRWDHSDWKPTACAGEPIRAWESTGWARPSATTAPPPAPAPAPPAPRPPATPEAFRMDRLDLSKVTSSSKTFVTGRHMDNLQAVMLPILAWTKRDFSALLGSNGAPDGIGGPGTAKAVEECQNICLFFGKDIGATKADRIVGPATWRSLIEF